MSNQAVSKYMSLFQYFRQCPQLSQLWSVAAVEEKGVRVILPVSASDIYNDTEYMDTVDAYHLDRSPYLTVTETFQINCYDPYDPRDNNPPRYNSNVLTLDEVQSICDWVFAQDEAENFPEIGETVVAIDCVPPVPQIRYVDDTEQTICYYITVRIRYINGAAKRHVTR